MEKKSILPEFEKPNHLNLTTTYHDEFEMLFEITTAHDLSDRIYFFYCTNPLRIAFNEISKSPNENILAKLDEINEFISKILISRYTHLSSLKPNLDNSSNQAIIDKLSNRRFMTKALHSLSLNQDSGIERILRNEGLYPSSFEDCIKLAPKANMYQMEMLKRASEANIIHSILTNYLFTNGFELDGNVLFNREDEFPKIIQDTENFKGEIFDYIRKCISELNDNTCEASVQAIEVKHSINCLDQKTKQIQKVPLQELELLEICINECLQRKRHSDPLQRIAEANAIIENGQPYNRSWKEIGIIHQLLPPQMYESHSIDHEIEPPPPRVSKLLTSRECSITFKTEKRACQYKHDLPPFKSEASENYVPWYAVLASTNRIVTNFHPGMNAIQLNEANHQIRRITSYLRMADPK